MAEPTLALSVQQPWAWLIVNGYKDIENRDWPTKVRGEIAIHAGKKFDAASYRQLRRAHPEIPFPDEDAFAMGGIVGKATIRDCVTASKSQWFAGKFGFVLTHQTPLPFTPLRGQLGFFKVAPTGADQEAKP